MKQLLPVNLRVLGLRFATLCVAAAVARTALAKEPTFEDVFSTKGEPHVQHYQALFSTKGSEHRLEVWRDGDKLKRSTDKAIDTYVFRQHNSAEFQMSVLDKKKKIHTKIGRTNLYRIGNVTDWFDLAHGLKHPVGAYKVAKAPAPPDGAPKDAKGCQWYDLTQNDRTTHICWSVKDRLPLVIQAKSGEVVWKLTSVDTKPIPAKTFEIHDEGYIRNDANEDIEGD